MVCNVCFELGELVLYVNEVQSLQSREFGKSNIIPLYFVTMMDQLPPVARYRGTRDLGSNFLCYWIALQFQIGRRSRFGQCSCLTHGLVDPSIALRV